MRRFVGLERLLSSDTALPSVVEELFSVSDQVGPSKSAKPACGLGSELELLITGFEHNLRR